MKLSQEDRILIFVPHPDDETIACGGLIQRAIQMKLPLRLVYLTYGDANEWSFIRSSKWKLPTLRPSSVKLMGEKRYQEAKSATKILGIPQNDVYFLGYPDFGTLKIWYKHWRNEDPEKGLFTRADKVPYATAFRPGASYKGEEIIKDITTHLEDFRPTKVFTSHRLDLNSDHQALYLFVRVALWNIREKIKPKYFAFLVHFKNWPVPKSLDPKLKITPPELLRDKIIWEEFPLLPEESARKLEALKAHETQMAATTDYLESFIRSNELFGDFRILLTKEKLLEEAHHQEGGNYQLEYSSIEESDEEEFIGLMHQSIKFDNEYLIEEMTLTRRLRREAVVTCYIFPYKFGTDFAQLPKYRIKIGHRSFEVLDVRKSITNGWIQIQRDHEKNIIEMKFPLDLLKDPDMLFINIRSEIFNVTVDWVPWRIIKMG